MISGSESRWLLVAFVSVVALGVSGFAVGQEAAVTREEGPNLVVTAEGAELVFPNPGPPGNPPDLDLGPPGNPPAAGTFYTDRSAFEAALDTIIVDDYSSPTYPAGFGIYGNVVFSAFFGETDYFTTGFAEWNFHLNDDQYCAGCNGSFRLSFQTTSLTQGGLGVYGVGFDITNNTEMFAYVTYADSSTEEVSLQGASFFGVTSDSLVASVHVGLSGGEPTTELSIVIDNLTIGNEVIPVELQSFEIEK